MPNDTGPSSATLQIFGANLVVTNKPNLRPCDAKKGRNHIEMYGLEIDIVCERQANGLAPTNTHIRGTWTTGNCEVQPDGALIGHYVGFAGAFTGVPFKEGLRTMDGACETSLMAGIRPGSESQGSAPIKVRSRDGSTTVRLGQISTDPGGNIVLAPVGSGAVVLAPDGIASAFLMRASSLEVSGNATVAGTLLVNGTLTTSLLAAGGAAITNNISAGGTITATGAVSGSGGSFSNVVADNINFKGQIVALSASGGTIPPGYKALMNAG